MYSDFTEFRVGRHSFMKWRIITGAMVYLGFFGLCTAILYSHDPKPMIVLMSCTITLYVFNFARVLRDKKITKMQKALISLLKIFDLLFSPF